MEPDLAVEFSFPLRQRQHWQGSVFIRRQTAQANDTNIKVSKHLTSKTARDSQSVPLHGLRASAPKSPAVKQKWRRGVNYDRGARRGGRGRNILHDTVVTSYSFEDLEDDISM